MIMGEISDLKQKVRMTIKASCFCHTNIVITVINIIKKCGDKNQIALHIWENTRSVNDNINIMI